MKFTAITSIILLSVTVSTAMADRVANSEEFRDRWPRDCSHGQTCSPATGMSASAVNHNDVQAMVDNREIFDHNGSAMIVNPNAGTIVYRDPKKSISGMVKPGALLFKAASPWDAYDDKALIKGTAYVFKRGCNPAPYAVSGRQKGWHTLVLKGAAPVRAKSGCNVIGYKINSNSTLKFVSWGD